MNLKCSMCGERTFTLTLKAGVNKESKRGVWAVDCTNCSWGIKIAIGGKNR